MSTIGYKIGRFQFQGGTKSELEASDLILLENELVLEEDEETGSVKIKRGNGKSKYINLPYIDIGTISVESLSDEDKKKMKGPKGDPGKDFTYDMFTPDQKADLKGEKGDTGDAGNDGQSITVEGVSENDDGSIKILFSDGKSVDIPKGPQGPIGKTGKPGKDGIVTFESLTEEQIDSIRGPKGEDGVGVPQTISLLKDRLVLSDNGGSVDLSIYAKKKDAPLISENDILNIIWKVYDANGLFIDEPIYKNLNAYTGTNLSNNIINLSDLINSQAAIRDLATNKRASIVAANSLAAVQGITNSSVAMKEVAKSSTAIREFVNSFIALREVMRSNVAVKEIANSTVAMQEISNSYIAVKEIINSAIAIKVIANSSVAMNVISNSRIAMLEIIKSNEAIEEIANSSVAMREISKSPMAVTEIINSTEATQRIINSSVAMKEISKSNEAMNVIVASDIAIQEISNSNIAMKEISNSNIAMKEIINSSQAVKYIIDSSVAMQEVANSTVAMRKVIESPEVMKEISQSNIVLDELYKRKKRISGSGANKTGKFIVLDISPGNYYGTNYGYAKLSDNSIPNWSNFRSKYSFIKEFGKYATYIQNDRDNDDWIDYYEIT